MEEINNVEIILGTPGVTKVIINGEKMKFVQKIEIEQSIEDVLATIKITMLASKLSIDGKAMINFDIVPE